MITELEMQCLPISIKSRIEPNRLWKNFLISERIKYFSYTNKWTKYWFWRTKEQKEIDFAEEENGQISTFEFKWNPDTKVQFPKIFSDNFPNSSFEIVNRDNFDEFLM